MTPTRQTPGELAELEALVALAQRQRNAGRLAEAAAAYRELIALRPDLAEAHNNLGGVLLAQGKLDEAAAHCQRALVLKPHLYQAHNSLGDICHAQGKLDEAVARYRQAIALAPDLAEAHNNLGAVLGHLGKLDAAAAHCQRALALKPDFFQATNNLGNICRKQGKLDEAVARYRQTIALQPDYAEAYHNLAGVLNEQEKLDEAIAQYQRVLALKPGFLKAYDSLGTLLHKQGKLDQAVALFEQAVALQPGLAEAHYNLGHVLAEQGKFERAVACFEQALALNPDDAEAHYLRADLKTFRPDDPDLAALEALAADPGRIPPAKMPYVHFALGKGLEDMGDYERAFQHWLQGNALKRRELDHDEAIFQREFRLVAETFDGALLSRLAGVGDPSPAPIFILGMPRSGSTLVEQILASHPQVQAAGELKNLDRVFRTLSEAAGRPVPVPACVGALDADSLRQRGQDYLASLPALADGKTRITDKMPGNFLYVGLIRLILPNARIIHTTRDPIDTCLSCFSRLFGVGQVFSYDLAELGRYYRGYHGLMAHWRSVLPAGAMLDVAYEDVVDNLEEQARRLIDFCGLPWDDRCLNFHETRRPIATSSNVQVRRPLYRSSVQRWRRYEAHLQPLLAELALLPPGVPDDHRSEQPAASEDQTR